MPVSVDVPLLTTARTRLRPLEDGDVPTLRAARAHPEVARWWHPAEDAWPFEDDDTARWAVALAGSSPLGPAGAVVGFAQAFEGQDVEYDECSLDLFLAASVHRRGLGREVVTVVRDWLVHARGHHLVTIDPAADNEAAIACYRSCGFRPVGVLPRRERDTDMQGWHDTLLMAYSVDPQR
jgi:RimJ/RimL family protein N-acetyltransferase